MNNCMNSWNWPSHFSMYTLHMKWRMMNYLQDINLIRSLCTIFHLIALIRKQPVWIGIGFTSGDYLEVNTIRMDGLELEKCSSNYTQKNWITNHQVCIGLIPIIMMMMLRNVHLDVIICEFLYAIQGIYYSIWVMSFWNLIFEIFSHFFLQIFVKPIEYHIQMP